MKTPYGYAKNIHLTGICCLFLASKYQDVWAIPMSNIMKEISHGKFTM